MSKIEYKHICDYCGCEYLISSSTYNRLLKNKIKHSYCSRECKSNAEMKKIECKCDQCGKKISKRLSEYISTKNHFCSHECADLYRHLSLTEERKCPICNKIFRVGKQTSQTFCSMECQAKWQTTCIGTLSSRYKENNVKCDWCGKVFHVNKYRSENSKRIFCSIKCRQEWYANVFSQSESWKEQSKIRVTNMLSSNIFNKTNSKPQMFVNNVLDELKINYINEFNVKYYSLDNFLNTEKLFIEVNGDYWHANPLIFSKSINSMQANRIKKDKAKRTYIEKYYHYPILYIWENDVKHNPNMVKILIQYYINNNGYLNNYHSFNYHIENGYLVENLDIIYPYQEQNFECYKNLIC